MNQTELEQIFNEYREFENEIVPGIIKKEHIDWLTEKLGLKSLKDEELSPLWHQVNDFFTELMIDQEKNTWKPGMHFERDTESAWLEVINLEARHRREDGTWTLDKPKTSSRGRR